MNKWRSFSDLYQQLRSLLRRALGKPAHSLDPISPPLPPPRAALAPLLAGHGQPARAGWRAAADTLVRHADASLPLLQEGLGQAADELTLHRLAQVCARIGSPAAQLLLLAQAQRPDLLGRAAGLRALGSLPHAAAEAHVFHRLAEEELRLAQHLLHGMQAAKAPP